MFRPSTGPTTPTEPQDLSPALSFYGDQVAYIQSTVAYATLLGGAVTSGLTAFTVTSGLTASDVGAPISGTGIPTGDIIASVTNATHGTLAAAATASGSSLTLTVGGPSLVVLKMASSGGTVAGPITPTFALPANYHSCSAGSNGCYTQVALNGGATDTNSAPFYDYGNDLLYVGDDNGKIHKITGIFNGSPTEVTTNWPVSTATGTVLTSPVYDIVSNNVFAAGNNGILYRVPATGGGSTASGQIATSGSTDFTDAPMVDSMPATPVVYVFSGDDAAGNGGVTQMSATFQWRDGDNRNARLIAPQPPCNSLEHLTTCTTT